MNHIREMKGILIFFVLLSFTGGLSLHAFQANSGIKGGMGVSGLFSKTGDFRHAFGYEIDWLSMGNLFGGQIGLFKTINITNNFQLQPELFYVNWGGNGSETFVFEKMLYRVSINYIQAPLLMKMRLRPKKKVHPVLLLGPYLALKVMAKKHTEIWGEKEVTDLNNVKSTDYGLTSGIGFELDLKERLFLFEIRLNLGFKNIMTVPDNYIRLYEEKDSIKNFSFSLMTGYSF